MHRLWLSIGVLAGLFVLAIKGMRSKRSIPSDKIDTAVKKVSTALASGDVGVMTSTLEETEDLLLKDALLGHIVADHYRNRDDPPSRKAFYRYAVMHIELAPKILDAREQSYSGKPEQFDSFRMIAIAMEEDEHYNAAIDVCRRAVPLGLDDGTKTGFEGRIARLTKKKNLQSGNEG